KLDFEMIVPVERVAYLLALMLKRSNKTKGRISEKTLRIISGRQRLRGAFHISLYENLASLGLEIIELDRGGFALFYRSILEGVPVLRAKDLIPREERASLSLEDIIKEFDDEADDVNVDVEE
ncbi:hypothetical protein L3216_000939, partial [Acinetobacter baumannii]